MSHTVIIDGVEYAPKDDLRRGLEELYADFLKYSNGLANNERNRAMNDTYSQAAVKVRNLLDRKFNQKVVHCLPL